MSKDFREIIIRPDVTLPPVSTDQPGRPYAFITFLTNWILQDAPAMRKEENLEYLFEWEDAITTFSDATEKEVTIKRPEQPKMPAMPVYGPPSEMAAEAKSIADKYNAAMEEYRDACKPYEDALSAARVGKKIYVSDKAFCAAKTAAKSALDDALTKGPQGTQTMNAAFGPKVLRHYHAFCQSQKLNENELPSKAKAELNGHAATDQTGEAHGQV